MGRRDYGTGSIREVEPGVWKLRVSAGTDPVTGKRVEVKETYRGPAKAARARHAELVAKHSGRQPDSTVTLERIVDEWLEVGGHAKRTRANYDRAKTRIPAAMLTTQARKITPNTLTRLYQSIAAKHGPNPAHQLHALISGAYTNARRNRWVTEHPARDLPLPELPKRKRTKPSAAQTRAILAHAADDEQRLWLRLAVVLGRRRSDVLAIRHSRVDLARKIITIDVALDADGTLKDTKTHDEPELAIDDVTVKLLRTHMRRQRQRALAAGEKIAPDPFLFSLATDSSTPWRPDLASRRWRATCKRAKVPSTIRLMDARHNNVSELIAGGIDVRAVAGRAGHNPEMSLGTYAHVVDAANRRAADIAAALIDGTG